MKEREREFINMINNIQQLPFDEDILKKISSLLQLILDKCDNVTKVILFGSFARCEQKITSDIDILVLSNDKISRDIMSTLTCDFEENHADVVFFTERDFSENSSLLVKQIRKDGVLLWQN